MVNLFDLLEILRFQLRRDLFNLMRNSLELLEKSRDNSLKLERLAENLGFNKDDDKEFFRTEEIFKISRKQILDDFNSKTKEIDELIKKFNVDKR